MDFFIERNFQNLKQIEIDNFHCPNCKTKTILNLMVKGGFISIFLIPILPIKKDYVLICKGCNKRIYKKNLNYTENEKVDNEFRTTNYIIPLKHFTGFAFLILILGFGIYTGLQIKKEEQKFIKKPKVKDVYFVKNDLGWTTLRVCKVGIDSIYVLKNKITLHSYEGIHEIEKSENYIYSYGIKRIDVEKMFESNEIYEIKRD